MPVLLVRFEWADGTSVRYYANSYRDVEWVLEDMTAEQKNSLTAIRWPDDEED